jgi:TRAP-type C4-dicarboxylate transport system permease small subunit
LSEGGGLGPRIREAWALSQPRGFSVGREEEAEPLPMRWPERVQEAATGTFYLLTFISIVVAVFYRFVLNQPLIWSIELPTYFFFWCFCLGTGLSDWDDDQISFDLVSARLAPRLRLAASAIGNLLIVVPFVVVLPGTIDYLAFQNQQPSTGVPVSQAWGFGAILPFFLIGILLRGRLLVGQVRALWRRSPAHPGDRR